MGKKLKTTVSADGSQSYVRRTASEKKYKSAVTKAGNRAMATARKKHGAGSQESVKVAIAVGRAEKATTSAGSSTISRKIRAQKNRGR